MLYMRAIPGKMRTDEVYAAAFGSVTCINIGLHASKTNGLREIVVPRRRRAGQRLTDMNITSHEYAVYACDTGKDAHGRGLCCRIWFYYIHKYWASRQ